MNRIRTKLLLSFLAATLVPLGATLWFTTSLLEHSLRYTSTEELDRLSRTLEQTGRELYAQYREGLKRDAQAGRIRPTQHTAATRESWPEEARQFWDTGQAERFILSGDRDDTIEWLVRKDGEVWVYSKPIAVRMANLTDEYRRARGAVDTARTHDLRRGLTSTLILLAASVWALSLGWLVYLAWRVSKPIQQLTAGLSALAAGDLTVRLERQSRDEVGDAVQAFNDMAEQLQRNKERLVYLTQVASWQSLGRKMAHELKNSLTPIRLTVEEMLARQPEQDQAFLQQAAKIVIDEVEGLERRVRAFSQFSAEPEPRPERIDLNAVAEERVAFLKSAHTEVTYELQLCEGAAESIADVDLVKGILTNLLENAAEAAGPGGLVKVVTDRRERLILAEVHDSGPGLSEDVRRSLFEPTISFKRNGMGLGLSISRKSALLCGGDLSLAACMLRGAGFRLELPAAPAKRAGDKAQPPDAGGVNRTGQEGPLAAESQEIQGSR